MRLCEVYSGTVGWMFARSNGPVRGLYIFGEVGRGKTMLMDLFYEAATSPKRRVHFHGFLADAHERIHAYRQALKRGEVKGDDPILPVADALLILFILMLAMPLVAWLTIHLSLKRAASTVYRFSEDGRDVHAAFCIAESC